MQMNYQVLNDYFKNYTEIDPKPQLLRLTNPYEHVWRAEPAKFAQISQAEWQNQTKEQKQNLLFIHGISYHDKHEALQDLVNPFTQCAHLAKTKEAADKFNFNFVSWNSGIIDRDNDPEVFKEFYKQQTSFLFRGGWRHLGRVLTEMEERAKLVGGFVTPYLENLQHLPQRLQPLVITHSFGALVWAQAVKNLIQEDMGAARRPGSLSLSTWLNLQPAVEHYAYDKGAAYADVAHVYAKSGAHQHVWYSKFDWVLASIFFLAKKCFAMGQIGPKPQRNLTRKDVTWHALEAHGVLSWKTGMNTHNSKLESHNTVRAASEQGFWSRLSPDLTNFMSTHDQFLTR